MKNSWKIILIMLFSLFLGIALAGCDKEPEELIEAAYKEGLKEYERHEYAIFDELKQEWVSCDGYWEWVEAQKWNETVGIWPRVIVDPNYEYAGENIREQALADGLSAWGICMAGNKPPQNFGLAMVKIGKIVGVLATPENLMEVAIDFKEN